MIDQRILLKRFRQFAQEEPIDLFEGALLISQLIDAAEDVARAREEVERLAGRVREARIRGASPEEALRVLFSEEGFRGDAETYDDPENSSVARVLAGRRGMPITLSIVVLESGRRSGLKLSGIGLPGHFVVGGPDLPEGHFLDPFGGGTLCDAEAIAERLGAIFGTPIELPPEAFAPDAPRAILIRVLLNLRRSYERLERFDEALAALEFAQALEPAETAFGRERGLLLLRCGRTEEALQSLEAYVAARTGDDTEAIRKLIAILRGQTAASESAGVANVVPVEKKIFSLEGVRELLPRVQEITSDAVFRYARLGEGGETEEERQEIVQGWARQVVSLGGEIKGLWLVDFDSGAGYYCWKYPETSLEYFHGYEEGFAGRLPLQ